VTIAINTVLLVAIFVVWLLAAMKVPEPPSLSWWHTGWALVALLVLLGRLP
jgi:hypothetical protein